MDLSIILSAIALTASILSPILTAWINKSKELKIIKLEVYEKRKLDNLETYYSSVSGTLTTIGLTKEFAKYHNIIYMYAPSILYDDISKLHELASKSNQDNKTALNEARKLLANIIITCTPTEELSLSRKQLLISQRLSEKQNKEK